MSHIQIRISEEEKEYAQQLFSSMGLTMSGAIKLFIRKSIQSDALPFSIASSIVKTPKKQKPKKIISSQESLNKKNRSFSNFINKEI